MLRCARPTPSALPRPTCRNLITMAAAEFKRAFGSGPNHDNEAMGSHGCGESHGLWDVCLA